MGSGVALGAATAHVLTGHGRRERPLVLVRAPGAILATTLADALDQLLFPRPHGASAAEVRVTPREIAALAAAAPSVTVAVAGDLMLDETWTGSVERVAPEAPVPAPLARAR